MEYQPEQGAMVVKMVVKIAAGACLYAVLWSSPRLSLSVTVSVRVMLLSRASLSGVLPCAVLRGVRDVVHVGIDDWACQGPELLSVDRRDTPAP